MTIYRIVAALTALACSVEATAQSSNCMAMGGMVHCDNMGTNGSMSSTNCTALGGGMAHCDTTGLGSGGARSSNGESSSLIGMLISHAQEQSFQKKVSKMMAAGDCQGAVRLAVSNGRVAMGDQIRRSCTPTRAGKPDEDIAPQQLPVDRTVSRGAVPLPSPANTRNLDGNLNFAAAKANAATPMALDASTTITKAEAVGNQLLLTADVQTTGVRMSESKRASVRNELCANQLSPALLAAGASIRIKYVELNGKEVGSVMVTSKECGL